jgi:DNA-binding response OmpR family regulator
MTTDSQPRVLSFGDFRLDCRSGELRKGKREIRLQPQPAKLLVVLWLLVRRSRSIYQTTFIFLSFMKGQRVDAGSVGRAIEASQAEVSKMEPGRALCWHAAKKFIDADE